MVLVVDDDSYTRRIIRLLLEKEKYQVQEAEDGETALRMIQTTRPDLILTDLMMPGINGIETTRQVFQLPGCRRIPIMMITAVNEPDIVDQAFAVGVADYFVKPINWPVLRQRIKRLLTPGSVEFRGEVPATFSQTLIDQALDGVITLTESGIIQFANAAVMTMFGYDPGSLEGLPIYILFPNFRIPHSKTEGILLEMQGHHRELRPFPTEVSVNLLKLGKERFLSLVIRDLRRRASALQKQAELTTNLDGISSLKGRAIEAAQVGFVIVDLTLPDAPLVFANQAFCELTGYPLGEVLNRNCRFLQGPDTDPETVEQLRAAISRKEACTVVIKNYRRDKTPFWNRLSIAPIATTTATITKFVGIQTDVTLQKQITEASNPADAFLLMIIRTIPSGIAAVDASGKLTFVNQRLCEITGYSAEDLVGTSLSRLLLLPGQIGALRRKSQSGVTELKLAEQELNLRRADQQIIFVRLRLATLPSAGSTVVVVEDLSERERTQALIKQAEMEWVATVDTVSDLILLEDDSHRLRRCNYAAASFFYRHVQDMVGENLFELFSALQIELHPEVPLNTWHPLRLPIAEVQFTNREGWFEITNYQISAERGFGLVWVHIVKNITSRKQVEADLLRLNAAIEQAADAIVLTDTAGTIVYANPAFEKTTGYRRADAVGCQLMTFHRQVLAREVFHGGPVDSGWQGQYSAPRQDGSVYDEDISVSPIKNKAGETINFVAVFRDVTEKNRLESIAEAVNMMDNVGFIFSGIRHELGNPINSIKVALTVLQQNLELAPRSDLDKYLRRSFSEIGRVEYLLQSLKTFSLHEKPRLKPVVIHSFLEKFLQLVEEDFAKRNIQIEIYLPDDPIAVLADPRALQQVFLNLFSNAADALAGLPNPVIDVQVRVAGNQVLIAVCDNGIGITSKQMEHLFKPFNTSKPHGTGLGLVIVKKMLVNMRGTIHIESLAQAGTQVTLSLELALESTRTR
ncbi:MAG TPA: PAS domain-containing protein [Acidobacteriota bacterium]|nr:PAS domain-containing protein [Acidobacteriota bacterium]